MSTYHFDDMTLSSSTNHPNGLIVEADGGKTRTFRGLRARLVRALLDHAARGWAEANALRAQNDDLAAARSRAVRERDEAVEREGRLVVMRDRYAQQVRAVQLALIGVEDLTSERIRKALRVSR